MEVVRHEVNISSYLSPRFEQPVVQKYEVKRVYASVQYQMLHRLGSDMLCLTLQIVGPGGISV